MYISKISGHSRSLFSALKSLNPPILCRYFRGMNVDDYSFYRISKVRRFLEVFPGFKFKGRRQPTLTGNHPGEMPTYEQLLDRLCAFDEELDREIDIGLPMMPIHENQERKSRRRALRELKNDSKLEKLARTRKLEVPLDEVMSQWEKGDGPSHIKTVAEHYGVYDDLFDGAHFFPRIPLRIAYDYDDEFVTPVYRGNHVKPSEAKSAPNVHFEAAPDTLWTLVLTNPDGHLRDNSAEYLHWFIGNIPGNDVGKGDLICDYLQPFPPKGTGFHRLIFILYKQEQRVDYSELKSLQLQDRTFKTYDFYKERQDKLTPAGLAFFQCDWDECLHDFFHNTLNMREPIFEFTHPPHHIREQQAVPENRPFNLYLDKYRDPKDISKEILLKRLKKVNPFQEERKPKYPNLAPYPRDMPSWQRTELYKENLRIGKYRGLDVHIFKPERYHMPIHGKPWPELEERDKNGRPEIKSD